MNRRTLICSVSLCAGMVCLFPWVSHGAAQTPLYRNAAQPMEVRINDLLSRMTLAEKVGQINMPCVYESRLGRDVPAKTEGCKKFTLGQKRAGRRAGRRLLHSGEYDSPRGSRPAGDVLQ